MGTCFVRLTCVPRNYVCAIFNLTIEVISTFINARPNVRSVVVTLNNKQTCSSWCVNQGFTNLEKRGNQSKQISKMCIAENVKTKNVFIFQPFRNLKIVSSTAKRAKTVIKCWKFHLRKKPISISFGGDSAHCFTRKMSPDYKRAKQSPFPQKYLRQSQSITPAPERKKNEKYSVYEKTAKQL